MSEKFDFNSIYEMGEKIKNEFTDPNNLAKITNGSLEKVFDNISKDESYSYGEKLMFFAKVNDLRKNRSLFEIIEGALPFLNNQNDFSCLNSDWLVDFYDKASKIVSDDFKLIWSRILAEEVNNPNSISKRLLHNLYLMSKNDAESFINLSRFCFYDKYSDLVHPIIFYRDCQHIYESFKIDFNCLKQLEHFSLIECDFESGFVFNKGPNITKKVLMYTNHIIEISANIIKAGNVRLSEDGQKLFNIIEKHNDNQILDCTVDKWRDYNHKVIVNFKR